MSLTDAMARIAQIQQLNVQVVAPPAANRTTTQAPPDAIERRVASSSFSDTLAQAQGTAPSAAATFAPALPAQPQPQPGTGTGPRALAWAQTQIGQAEEP